MENTQTMWADSSLFISVSFMVFYRDYPPTIKQITLLWLITERLKREEKILFFLVGMHSKINYVLF